MSTPALNQTETAPWIEVFRAGDYGDKGRILASDLDRVIAKYDPSFHEAPVTVGHPESNSPAYAWVEGLKRDGDLLLAKEKDVDPEFSEARKAGRYKKRSVSFYRDADGNVIGLRHVAYLGGKAPEVKGLKDVQFHDEDKKVTEVTFEESGMAADEKSLIESLNAWFREKFGNSSPVSFSEKEAKTLIVDGIAAAIKPLQEKISDQETKLAKQAAEFAERESKLGTSELKQRVVELISGLKQKGRWIPAFDKMGLPVVFEELAKGTATVEFGEGDAKRKVTPLQLFTDFMEGLPKIVPAGTTYNVAALGAATVVDFGERADPNSVSLHQLATKRSQDKGISYGDALEQVAKENPNLTRPGSSAAGQV